MHDRTYTRACLEQWAKWLFGARVGEVSLTGRLMAGVRANVCPQWLEDVAARKRHDPFCALCGGRGRLKLELRARRHVRSLPCSVCDADGKFMGDWCWRCKGTRRIEIVDYPVNPASIRRSGYGGGGYFPSAACLAIDDLVGAWRESDATIWWNRVIVREYTWLGTQEMKARRQPSVSVIFYKRRLREAHEAVDDMLWNGSL